MNERTTDVFICCFIVALLPRLLLPARLCDDYECLFIHPLEGILSVIQATKLSFLR